MNEIDISDTPLPSPLPPSPIDLEAAPPVAQGIDLEDTTKPPVSTETAEDRSGKAHYGWPEGKSPGREIIKSAMMTGAEQEMRQRAVSDANAEYRQNKLDLVKETSNRFSDVNPKETNAFLEGLIKADPVYKEDSVFEQRYANQYVNRVITNGQRPDISTVFQRGLDEYFNATIDTSHIAQGTADRLERFKTIAEDAETVRKNQGWGGYLVDRLKDRVPVTGTIYSWVKMYDQTAVTDAFLPGDNLAAQVQNLWLLPIDEAQKTLKEAVERLQKDNPGQAKRLAEAAVAYGTSQQLLDNLFAVGDLVTAPGIGTVASLGLRGAKGAAKAAAEVAEDVSRSGIRAAVPTEVRKAFADSVKGLEGKPTPESVLAANGHTVASAELRALKIMKAGDPNGDAVDMAARVPSLFRFDTVVKDPTSLSREATDRLVAQGQDRATRLIRTLDEPGKVNRAPDEAYQVGIKEAKEELSRRYPHLNDAILDVETRDGELLPYKYNRPEDNHANVGSVSVHVGKPDASLFDSGQEAAMYADRIYKLDMNDPGLRINQQGSGFYLSITKNIDETSPGFRAALISTNNTTPKSLANEWLGRLRNPEDLLSDLQRNNRHVLTHASELIKSQFVEAAKDVSRNLGKKQIDRMERVFEMNRAYQDPVSGQVGTFYTTAHQFEDAYFTLHGIRPTEAEYNAYFTYIQLNDMDWVVRNLGWYRDKARMGVENMSFSHVTTDEAGHTALTKTKPFEGKYLSELPWKQTEDAGIYVVDGEGKGSVYRKNFLSAETKESIQAKIREGYRIIQLYSPTSKPFGLQDNVHFVIAKDAETTKLAWMQAPYRPGGHVEYVDNWFTKQPKITRYEDTTGRVSHVGEGDVAAFSHSTEAEAKEFSSAMETGRLLLNRGLDKELEDHLARSLPYSKGQFKNLFQDYTDGQGKPVKAVFSKDHPFMHTESGQTTAERAALDKNPFSTRYENFEDTASSPYNLSANSDKKFAGTRDTVLPTVEKRGTETNPVFQLKKSQLIDPMTTLNRSMANIMRSRMMTDYKTSAVESWIQEFGHITGKSMEDLRSNPVAHFHETPSYVPGANEMMIAAANNARRNILNLLGTESPLAASIRNAQSSVMDKIYEAGGQGALGKLATVKEYTPNWLISTISDPAKAMRSIAFHATQGVFNPVQLFLQAQTLTHVIAVAGLKNGLPGMMAGGLMRKLALTEQPAVVNRMAEIAQKMGFMKKEEFLESYTHFRKAGLHHVEGEVANLDDVLDPKMFTSTGKSWLDKGVFFFREGERLVRYAAWNTAYREWKAANPLAELTNQARNEILTRSNLFGANMTRASSAAWQQGIMSVPSQFYGYPTRLAEQFLGKRLTAAEKAHAFAVYGAMYGVPAALSTASAIPFYEDMKTYALEKGYDIHNNFFKAAMEGIPSMMWSVVTGQDTNFAQRYGSNGISAIHDIASGNMSLAKFVLGASGSIVGGMATAFGPLLRSLTDPLRDENERIPLKMDDFQEAASVLSGVNNTMKAAIGYASQRYTAKHGVYVSDITSAEAMNMFFGLTPRRVTDANMMARSMADTKKDQAAWEKVIVEQYNRALEEGAKGNTQAMDDYLRRAKVYFQAGNFQATQAGQILTKSLKGWESKIDQVQMNFIKNAPKSDKKGREEAYYGKTN